MKTVINSMGSSQVFNKSPIFLGNVFSLLTVNLFSLGYAINQNFTLGDLALVYVVQSIIIGIFQALKMLSATNIIAKGLKMNGRAVTNPYKARYSIVGFFILHYGIFHSVYLVFASSMASSINSGNLLLLSSMFFLNHLYSFVNYYSKEKEKLQNIGAMMFSPYPRIIPMHIIIIFGSFIPGSKGSLIVFVLLKTIVDVLMHGSEHYKKSKYEK
jgi:hypothetical protein